MSGRTATTHGESCATKLLAHCAPMNAQLGTDLAEAPALGVQVGCSLDVHGDTVTSKQWHSTTACCRPTGPARPAAFSGRVGDRR